MTERYTAKTPVSQTLWSPVESRNCFALLATSAKIQYGDFTLSSLGPSEASFNVAELTNEYEINAEPLHRRPCKDSERLSEGDYI